MPLVHVTTTQSIPAAEKKTLCEKLSRIAAEVIGKPESYVMTCVGPAALSLAGSSEPAAFVDVRSIGGLAPRACTGLSERLCALLAEALGVPGGRVYLNFTEIAAAKWGHDGSTFG